MKYVCRITSTEGNAGAVIERDPMHHTTQELLSVGIIMEVADAPKHETKKVKVSK